MSIMNPQDAMLLFITASQDYLVIHFVYLQLSCTTSNFGSLTRGNPHSPYFNHILLSVPTRRISAIPRVYLDIQLRFTWPGYNPGVIVVGKEGKNLDLRSSRSLQSTLPDENDTIKKKSSNRLALLRPSPLQFMKFTLIFTRQPSGLGKKLGIKLTKVMGNKVGIRLLNFRWPFCCRGRHFIDVNIFLTSVVTWC